MDTRVQGIVAAAVLGLVVSVLVLVLGARQPPTALCHPLELVAPRLFQARPAASADTIAAFSFWRSFWLGDRQHGRQWRAQLWPAVGPDTSEIDKVVRAHGVVVAVALLFATLALVAALPSYATGTACRDDLDPLSALTILRILDCDAAQTRLAVVFALAVVLPALIALFILTRELVATNAAVSTRLFFTKEEGVSKQSGVVLASTPVPNIRRLQELCDKRDALIDKLEHAECAYISCFEAVSGASTTRSRAAVLPHAPSSHYHLSSLRSVSPADTSELADAIERGLAHSLDHIGPESPPASAQPLVSVEAVPRLYFSDAVSSSLDDDDDRRLSASSYEPPRPSTSSEYSFTSAEHDTMKKRAGGFGELAVVDEEEQSDAGRDDSTDTVRERRLSSLAEARRSREQTSGETTTTTASTALFDFERRQGHLTGDTSLAKDEATDVSEDRMETPDLADIPSISSESFEESFWPSSEPLPHPLSDECSMQPPASRHASRRAPSHLRVPNMRHEAKKDDAKEHEVPHKLRRKSHVAHETPPPEEEEGSFAPELALRQGVAPKLVADKYSDLRRLRGALLALREQIAQEQHTAMKEPGAHSGYVVAACGDHLPHATPLSGLSSGDVDWKRAGADDGVGHTNVAAAGLAGISLCALAMCIAALSVADSAAEFFDFLRPLATADALPHALATQVVPALSLVVVVLLGTFVRAQSFSRAHSAAFEWKTLTFLMMVALPSFLIWWSAFASAAGNVVAMRLADGILLSTPSHFALFALLAFAAPTFALIQPVRRIRALLRLKRARTPRQRYRALQPPCEVDRLQLALTLVVVGVVLALAASAPLITAPLFLMLPPLHLALRFHASFTIIDCTFEMAQTLLQSLLLVLPAQPVIFGFLLLSRSRQHLAIGATSVVFGAIFAAASLWLHLRRRPLAQASPLPTSPSTAGMARRSLGSLLDMIEQIATPVTPTMTSLPKNERIDWRSRAELISDLHFHPAPTLARAKSRHRSHDDELLPPCLVDKSVSLLLPRDRVTQDEARELRRFYDFDVVYEDAVELSSLQLK